MYLCQGMYVNSGDSIALIAGILIVFFVAILANPGYLAFLPSFRTAAPVPEAPQVPPPAVNIPVVPGMTPVAQAISVESHDLPFRIVYTDKPYTYPSYRIPDHMETFGASEVSRGRRSWSPLPLWRVPGEVSPRFFQFLIRSG